MMLAPKLPPGRSNRKALAFSAEIKCLRKQGYSFEAIRVALKDAGVAVSVSTVRREVNIGCTYAPSNAGRTPNPPNSVQLAPHEAPGPAQSSQARMQSLQHRDSGDARSGKEVAEDFMRNRITNPLMQERIAK
ncbi:hypothetical protein [Paucibacter sp. DJ2R-2]|uniref:hypothetical protein n=1 Tax=Paucibacter sp. DJ2R-2 TaxID=2893558 RepID=UPI0021E37886|nr:hypothetical protein [Paucibacter sp. DJ2R-2]MCV2438709.1 hypothetical protein [Paucibacter sp. DJ2R-2]